MPKPYSAILFDLGWTLVDLPDAESVKMRLKESLGLALFEKVRAVFHAWHATTWTVSEFVAQVEREVQLNDADRALLAAWGTNVMLVPFPDTLPTLRALKEKGHALAVVSNAPPIRTETLRLLGFDDFIDAWIFSSDVGAMKPDAKIFQAALDRLGVHAGAALMVGDALDKDVEGARAIGIDAVLIQRNSEPSSFTPTIRSLTELIDLV